MSDLGGWVSLGEAIDSYLTAHQRGDHTPIPTGFEDLNRLLGGFEASSLVILASRPSVGKTSLALNMAQAVAESGKAVTIFTLETNRDRIVERYLSSISRVPTDRIRVGPWTAEDEQAIMYAVGKLMGLKLRIVDTLSSLEQMSVEMIRLHSEGVLDFAVVDYLQLIHKEDNAASALNRAQEMSEITRTLKGLARTLRIPILALSQLSRAVEQRPDKMPQLSDLRESGSIEQDADVVMFIYRPAMYYTEGEWEHRFPDQDYPVNIAEIIVAKNRHGWVGSTQVVFRPETGSFANLYPVNLPTS